MLVGKLSCLMLLVFLIMFKGLWIAPYSGGFSGFVSLWY